MSRKLWFHGLAFVAVTFTTMVTQTLYGAVLLNYQFEKVFGSPPSGQTTPDASGNFVSTPGTINAVLGHGTNVPGSTFPNLIPGPVENQSAGVGSRNQVWAMNFPGNPATGNIASNIERVEIADLSSGALDTSFSNFTVALWLNPSSTNRDRFAIGKMGGASGSRGWQLYSPLNSTNLVFDYFSTASSADRSLLLANALPLNTWTHVIFAFDGINQTEALYINNVLQTPSASGGLTSVPTTLNSANSAAFRVGHRGATGNNVGAWAGGIDDVLIFNETLAFSATGSATGTGSLLVSVPEPTSFVVVALIAVTMFGVVKLQLVKGI